MVLLNSGATPQRREFVYPRQLHKARRRSELLDSLRRQQEELQEELQAALKEEEEQEEEPEEEPEEDKQSQADTVSDYIFSCFRTLEVILFYM